MKSIANQRDLPSDGMSSLNSLLEANNRDKAERAKHFPRQVAKQEAERLQQPWAQALEHRPPCPGVLASLLETPGNSSLSSVTPNKALLSAQHLCLARCAPAFPSPTANWHRTPFHPIQEILSRERGGQRAQSLCDNETMTWPRSPCD